MSELNNNINDIILKMLRYKVFNDRNFSIPEIRDISLYWNHFIDQIRLPFEELYNKIITSVLLEETPTVKKICSDQQKLMDVNLYLQYRLLRLQIRVNRKIKRVSE